MLFCYAMTNRFPLPVILGAIIVVSMWLAIELKRMERWRRDFALLGSRHSSHRHP